MKVAIIGSGVSGMAAACYLAQAGAHVTIFEKNSEAGGRARQFKADGFTFDMGPSWYWMPEVFEQFFNDFGKSASDYYELTRLSPSYTVYFEGTALDIPADVSALGQLFESLEPGSATMLHKYLADAKVKYELGMNKFAKKPSLGIREFMSFNLLRHANKLQLLTSISKHVSHYFKHPLIRKVMEFPVIFLGAMPGKIPAMYSMMNYADAVLGTWYPKGGMHRIIEAMYDLATSLGVRFEFSSDVTRLDTSDDIVTQLSVNGNTHIFDAFIGAGDYHHIETLLPAQSQSYSKTYWESRKMAPSCLLYYIGIDRKLPIHHHSLFFDGAYDEHAAQLYERPQWPENPLFYVCAPSVTDDTVAPDGHENLFVLVPIAAGIEGDTESLRERYLQLLLSRMESRWGVNIRDHIVYCRSYATTEFRSDYHAFKGNAYGLSNTLMQTAFLKPRARSKKQHNLFYCGQLTVPGPGLPPAFLSGKIAADETLNYLNQHNIKLNKPLYEHH